MKESVVTHVALKNSTDGQYGTVHYFTITFENGDTGDYGTKYNPQSRFMVGQKVAYTIERRVHGNYTNSIIKPTVTHSGYKGGGGSKNEQAANAREALRSATMLVGSGIYPVEQLTKVREKFYNWLNERSQ